MFGAKYCQFTISFGIKLNGRPRGAKTLIKINKVTHREFAILDLKSVSSDLRSRKLPRIEKLVDGIDDMAINENKWRNVNRKKLKTLIGSQDAIIKDFGLIVKDDRKKMVDLEIELNVNVVDIVDLLRQITKNKGEMSLLKYKSTIQSENVIISNAKVKAMHAREVSLLRFEIKNKSNESQKLKISRAMRRSKKNPIIIIEKTDDTESDEDVMENRESSRAVKSVMDVLELVSKKCIESGKIIMIINKVAKNIVRKY